MPPPTTNPLHRLGPGERQLGLGVATSTKTSDPKSAGYTLMRSGDRWFVRCTLTFDTPSKAREHSKRDPEEAPDFLERIWEVYPLTSVTPSDGVRKEPFEHVSTRDSPTHTVWTQKGDDVRGINITTTGTFEKGRFRELLALRQFVPRKVSVKGHAIIRDYECELWSGFVTEEEVDSTVGRTIQVKGRPSESGVSASEYEMSGDEDDPVDGEYVPFSRFGKTSCLVDRTKAKCG